MSVVNATQTNESFGEKLLRKSKEEPWIPVGTYIFNSLDHVTDIFLSQAVS
jgi:hypothetical protein